MIDQMCINSAVLAGAKEVFETMIFMNLEESCDPEQHIEGNTILGSITFNGELNGCLAIRCNMICAKAIARNMLGMDENEEITHEDIYDALGEVTNMVMGSIKSKLQDSVGNFQVSIPTIVTGQEIETSLSEGVLGKCFSKVSIDDKYIAELSLMYRENSK